MGRRGLAGCGDRIMEQSVKTDRASTATPRRKSDYSLLERFRYRCGKKFKDLRFVLNRDVFKNPAARRLHREHPVTLSEAQARVVQELTSRGIAMIHVDELLGHSGLYEAVAEAADAFEHGGAVVEGIRRYEEHYGDSSWKEYIVRRFGNGERVGGDDPLVRFALCGELLDTVNAYMGMWTRLLGVNLWYTIPLAAQRERLASQNWHRDPEDQSLVKVFLQFREVDKGAGPFEYVPGSRAGGKYSHLWPMATGSGTRGYIPDELIDEHVEEGDIVTGTCRAGTLIFCDTSGFHRGGFARENPRLTGLFMYKTPASLYDCILNIDRVCDSETRTPQAGFALE